MYEEMKPGSLVKSESLVGAPVSLEYASEVIHAGFAYAPVL